MKIHGIILVIIISGIIPIQNIPLPHLLPEISYGQFSTGASLSMGVPNGPLPLFMQNKTWLPGRNLDVTLIDSIANKNSNLADKLNVWDPQYESIPTLRIGNPFTLEGANASFFSSGTIITVNGLSSSYNLIQPNVATDIAKDEAISGRPIFMERAGVTINDTGGMIIDLKTTMQTLKKTIHDKSIGNPENFTGFNFINLDLRSLNILGQGNNHITAVKIFLAHSSSQIVRSDGNLEPNVKLISIANTTSLQDLIDLEVTSAKVLRPDLVNNNLFSVPNTDNIGLVFQVKTQSPIPFGVPPKSSIITDFFSFGIIGDGKLPQQRVNNAIYRLELLETDHDSSIFNGTIRYTMENQNTVLLAPDSDLTSIGDNIRLVANSEMNQFYFNTPQIQYLDLSPGNIRTVTAEKEILTHSGSVKLDQKQYNVKDTVTVTVWDADLDSDPNLQDIYTTVTPIGNLSADIQAPQVDTVGFAGSHNSKLGIMLEVVFGKDDTRWSNSIIPGDVNHSNACNFSTGGITNSLNGTTGRLATSLSATGFSLVETAPSSGIFIGTFNMPDEFCQSGNIISTTNQDMKVKYYDFSDGSGRFAQKETSVGGYGFVNTMQIVPQFSTFTKINHVIPLPGHTSLDPDELVPAIIFYRNSSVLQKGIDELRLLKITDPNNKAQTIDLLPSAIVNIKANMLGDITNNYAVAIFRNVQVNASSLDTDTKIGATDVWPNPNGDGIKVAILDSGLGINPDLNMGYCYNSFSHDNSNCSDTLGHGTHVAGIALANNPDPFKGVAPGASLMVIKVLNLATGDAGHIAEGMDRAIRDGADVINLSVSTTTPYLQQDCDLDASVSDEVGSMYPYLYAAASRNIPVVAAAGNFLNTVHGVSAPACISTAIAVGAVKTSINAGTPSWSPWSQIIAGSNITTGQGPSMVEHGVVAPGNSVDSTWPCELVHPDCSSPVSADHLTMSGTSMATPAVTGTVALVLQKAHDEGIPLLTSREISGIILSSADGISGNPQAFGHGIVNAHSAVNSIGTFTPYRATSTSITTNPTTIAANQQITITATVSDVGNIATASQPTGEILFTNFPDPDPTRFHNLSCNPITGQFKLRCTITYSQADSNPPKISALYYGDSVHDQSSAQTTLNVETTTTISPPVGPILPNSNIGFTATVSTATGNVNVGTVTFSTQPVAVGSFSPNSCTLPSCTVTYGTPSTTGGVTIVARYSGNPSHGFASSERSLPIIVTPEFPGGISIIMLIVFFAIILFARLRNSIFDSHI